MIVDQRKEKRKEEGKARKENKKNRINTAGWLS